MLNEAMGLVSWVWLKCRDRVVGGGVVRRPGCGRRRGEAWERPRVLSGRVLWTPRTGTDLHSVQLTQRVSGRCENETPPAVRMGSTNGSVKGQVMSQHVRHVGHSEPVTTPRLCHHR